MFDQELSLRWFSRESYFPAVKTLPPHSHTVFFHYIYVIDGNALLRVNGETAEAKPNLIMRAPLHTGTHSIEFQDEKEFLKTFEFKFCVSDQTLLEKLCALPFFEICDPNTTGNIPYEMLELANRHEAYYMEMLQLKFAQMLILFLAKRESPMGGLKRCEGDALVSHARKQSLLPTIQYMRTNYSHELKLAELAKHANLSKPYFCKLFKEAFGESPIQYLTKLRLDKACELLTYSELNVSQVAFEVGYSDIFNFSRTFKSYTGLSPKNYSQKFNPELYLFFDESDREREIMPNDIIEGDNQPLL